MDIAFDKNELSRPSRCISRRSGPREHRIWSALQFDGDATWSAFLPTSIGSKFEADDPLLVTAPFSTALGGGTVFIRGSDAFVQRELSTLNFPLRVGLALVMLALVVLYFFLRYRVSRPLQEIRVHR